jgi:hypothetical protein
MNQMQRTLATVTREPARGENHPLAPPMEAKRTLFVSRGCTIQIDENKNKNKAEFSIEWLLATNF